MFMRFARWIPANGILFAILVVVASLITSDTPGKHASDASWTAYYADAGNRHKEEIAFFLVGIAGLCFLSFLGSLRGLLARAEGEPARLTTAAVASGAAFIAVAIAAHAVGSAPSWTVTHFGESYKVDPQTARLFATLSFLLFVISMFAAAAMALAVTVLSLATRALPAWLAWFGGLAALGGVLSIFGIPSIVTLAWIAALSAWMLFPRAADARTPATAPMT